MTKQRFDIHNSIIWILLVTIVWYIFIFSLIGGWMFDGSATPFHGLIEKIHYMPDATKFTISMYLSTLASFIGAFVYTGVTRRNRFVFRTFLPSQVGMSRTVKAALAGLLVGFLMNFGCIVCALIHGDIKLFLNFSLTQIPFYLFALLCVFIQSSTEELWCRGFIYERINVRYPLWVAILVNGVFFGFLHIFNPGVSFLPILDICVCGIAFSIAKWYTGTIWFPAGIHAAWNFTQNYLFGLPKSGLVSEVSVFGLDAANAHDTLIYSVPFGVEGGVPAVFADAVLGIVCLILAARKGRLGELKQVRGQDPQFAAYLQAKKEKQDAADEGTWRYVDEEEKAEQVRSETPAQDWNDDPVLPSDATAPKR